LNSSGSGDHKSGNVNDDSGNRIPIEHIPLLIRLGSHYGFHPGASRESEEYFAQLIGECRREGDGWRDLIEQSVAQAFRTIAEAPEWIQSGDWQFADGRPMVFVGQIDVPAGKGWFHDDASFYVFWDPDSGETRTIIQVA
jgi:hypothetical protein